ncbi:hypothetical protein [Croceivirga thetidis]|uniref:Uncharacterized protein n=1 Tax=Croceivirga thetidis TaxID=2721623 RepID=A0ABX1GUE7_9FLAO|nr:hypothetical protein [Croceivirga thetidis]NKI33259.1 hypothetical protein [Croceivirga thetidis]
MKTRNALYIAGAILIASVIFALGKFENSNLIVATIMVVIAMILLPLGYRKDKELVKACLVKKPTKKKVAMVTVGVMAVFFGLGFAVGKLIYLWTHLE